MLIIDQKGRVVKGKNIRKFVTEIILNQTILVLSNRFQYHINVNMNMQK